jgi:hypothetical protein
VEIQDLVFYGGAFLPTQSRLMSVQNMQDALDAAAIAIEGTMTGGKSK